MFTKITTLIIPTRNRPYHILKTLKNLKNLKIYFDEIIIVDSSDKDNSIKNKKISNELRIKYFHTKASSSHQRNFGLLKAKKK